MVSIRCPSDCVYLHGTHDSKWTSESEEKEFARFFTRVAGLEERPSQFFWFLQYVLAHSKSPLSELEDAELAEVAATAASTLETRAKGVLYSHPTERLHLQPAAGWLTRLVLSRKMIPEAPSVADEETVAALRALVESVEDHSREKGRERYLAKLQRFFARSGAPATPIKLPADLDEPPQQLIVTP
jgi:hypothetical protein